MKTLFFAVCLTFCGVGLVQAFDNVLLISVDTLRPDRLGCYGSKNVQTPNIDSLARSGVLFKNAVSPAPYTLPSHISMMTGLIPPVHGVQDNAGFYLSPKVVTLAEIFRSQKIKTGAFVGAFPLDSRFGMDQGFDAYDDSYPGTNSEDSILMLERSAAEVTKQALTWLDTHKQTRWFVFLHYYEPHFPYAGSYESEITQVDKQIGIVLEFLQRNSLSGKTLIVFTSDHGESLGEHKEKTHGIFAYESTLRIPLIFSPFPARVVESRVRLIDIAPTILDFFELSFPSRIQGVSLMNFLQGKTTEVSNSYFEALSTHFNSDWAPLRGFYSGRMKYIDLPVAELYDLNADPGELNNLCSNAQLCNLWQSKFDQFVRPYRQTEVKPAEIDRETLERLRSLGYLAGGWKQSAKQYTDDDDPKRLIEFHNLVDSAIAYFNRGNQTKALDILERVIGRRPDCFRAYEQASFIKNSLGFPDQAADLLKAAIRNGVTNPAIFSKLAFYLYKAKKYDEALEQIKLAIRTRPHDIDNYIYLGMIHTARNNFAEAESAFKEALKLDPSNAISFINLGRMYIQQRKVDEAKKQFESAIAANPRQAEAYISLGNIYASRRNWVEAIKNWNLALKEDNANFEIVLKVALAHLENNEREKAVPLLQRFEAEAPPARYSEDLRKVRLLLQKLQY